MFATPVIERELRVRTRTRVTRWQRLLVASLAGLACAGTFTWSGQSPPGVAGQQLFRTLTAMAFIFCLVEGIRMTCDCLSRERREGTIGLLIFTICCVGTYFGSRAPTPPLALGQTLGLCVVGPLLGTWVLTVLTG